MKIISIPNNRSLPECTIFPYRAVFSFIFLFLTLLFFFLIIPDSVGQNSVQSRRQPASTQKDSENSDISVRQLKKKAKGDDVQAQIQLGRKYFQGDDDLSRNREKAAEWFRRAAEQNNPIGQFNYGICLDTGEGVKKDSREALKWYRKAAEKGLPEAKLNTAITAENLGEYELALQYYEEMASQGYSKSMRKSAELLEKGLGNIEINPDKAFRYMREAARNGDIRAQVKLADYYERGFGDMADMDKAIQWLWTAAGNGDPEAQSKIGACYQHGRGMKQNHKMAFRWFKRAAEAGYAQAQVAIGNAYLEATGIEQNIERSVEWYKKAADQKNPVGEFSLGVAYALGRGIDKDEQKAMKLFQRAAEKDYPPAQYNLGFFYEQGIAMATPDMEQAIHWYRQAAKKNDRNAVHSLALCLIYGRGVEKKDRDKGKELLIKAANLGSNAAIKDLRKIFDYNF